MVDPNHVLDTPSTEQRARVEIIEEGAQETDIVGRREDPASMGVHILDIPAVGVFAVCAVITDLPRNPFVDGGVPAAGPTDSEHRGDGLVVEHGVEGHIPIPATGVVEQVVDGDVIKPRVGGASRRRLQVENIDHPGVVAQQTPLDELVDGDAGDGFGRGGNAEERVRLDHLCIGRVPGVATRTNQTSTDAGGQDSAGNGPRLHPIPEGVVDEFPPGNRFTGLGPDPLLGEHRNRSRYDQGDQQAKKQPSEHLFSRSVFVDRALQGNRPSARQANGPWQDICQIHDFLRSLYLRKVVLGRANVHNPIEITFNFSIN